MDIEECCCFTLVNQISVVETCSSRQDAHIYPVEYLLRLKPLSVDMQRH